MVVQAAQAAVEVKTAVVMPVVQAHLVRVTQVVHQHIMPVVAVVAQVLPVKTVNLDTTAVSAV